jgi:hypothetical protein
MDLKLPNSVNLLFAHFALTMMLVVQMCDGFAEGLDAGGRAIFASSHGDVDGVWSLEAALYLCMVLDLQQTTQSSAITVVYLRRALPKVCPAGRVIAIATFVCSFGCPNDTGRSARRVESGVRLVAFMGFAELEMDRRVQF